MDKTEKINELKRTATQVRRNILTMIFTAQSGHPGGSLSAADVMTVLYFSEMNIRPGEPGWDGRDRFVLSKGHVCPVLYVCLAMRGYIPMEALGTLRKEGSMLQGHPDMKVCPGVDVSTGSLGQGLSIAVGMALRAKRDGLPYRTFALLGDGECNEGQIWEATATAAKYELDNLVILVDKNGLQNDNTCDVVMPSLDLAQKFRVFGCDTTSLDGHDIGQIVQAFDTIRDKQEGKPHCLILSTVKGKGVSYMENVVQWHGMAPDQQLYDQAMTELEGVRYE